MQSGSDSGRQNYLPPACSFLLRVAVCFFALTVSLAATERVEGKTIEDAYYEQAQKLIKRGDYDQAAKILLPIYRKHPQNAGLLVELGDCYLNDTTELFDSARKAEQCFKKAMQIDPELGRAYSKMTEWANLQSHFNLAIKMATKALSVKKPDYQAYLERSTAYSRLHRDKEALSDIEKFIALGNHSKKVYLRRAGILENLHLYARAASDYQTIQKIAFEDETALLEANCLEKANKTNEAIACLTELIRRNKEDDSAYERRARLLAKSGRNKEALDDYTKVIQLVPSATVLKERADLYEKMGRKDLATKDRKEAERI